MVVTTGKHYGIILEMKGRNSVDLLFLEDQEEELTSFKAIRKVHKVNKHKQKEQLVGAYWNAGCISPDVVNIITHVVNNCRVCQKFGKLMITPKVGLKKGTSCNEVVHLDLKEFGNKYVLWCIDSFTRFIQGKLLLNKKVETIMNSVNECWNMPFGIPSVGYYADNRTEFRNI